MCRTEGAIDAKTIAQHKLVDNHYYAIASKARASAACTSPATLGGTPRAQHAPHSCQTRAELAQLRARATVEGAGPGNDGGGLGKAEAVEEGARDKEDDRQEKRHHKDSSPFSRTPLVG